MSEKSNLFSNKRLICILAIAVAVMVILCAAIVILNFALSEDELDEGFEDIKLNYNFYEADYEENIFEDEDYLKLIEYGILEYDDGAMISQITQDNADGYGAPAAVVVNMIYAAINGDAEEYNSYFSKEYFKLNSKKDKFTMQKIYDGRIQLFAIEDVTKNDSTYTEYTFKVKYRIFENNGTFRNDIGDGYRWQHITVSDREGAFKIDAVNVVRYK